jgi:hypothetical protein
VAGQHRVEPAAGAGELVLTKRNAYPVAIQGRHVQDGSSRGRYQPLSIRLVSEELDRRVRLAAFQWLRAQMDVFGDVLPRSLLAEGFMLDGRRVPLLGPQGILKPALCDVPLLIGSEARP